MFIIIILVSLYIRLNKLDYPLASNGGEGITAYLVADHILQYKEFPPFAQDGGSGIMKYNSPLYFYLIALFLTIKNDVIFLGMVNIFFQVLSIFFVYLLAKKAFCPTRALIASSLFSFNPAILDQSIFVWQPYLMQPFVHLSLFFLLSAYLKKRFNLLLASVFFLIFSMALYKAAFALTPLYVLLILIILKKQKSNLQRYVIILATAIISLFLFYTSVLIFLVKASLNHPSFLSELLAQRASGHEYIQTLRDILMNFSYHATQLLGIFSLPNGLLLIIIISILLYFLAYKNKTSKKFTIVIVFFIIQQLIFTSFFKVAESDRFLNPILGLFPVLIAETIYSVFSRNTVSKIVMLIVVFFLFQTFSFNFQFLQVNTAHSQNFQTLETASDSIIEEVFQIQEQEGFTDINFFQIESYRTGSQSARDAILWTPLEKKLKRKFVKVDNGFEDDHPLKETNQKKFLFLACFSQAGGFYDRNECKKTFLKEHPGYSIMNEIYDDKLVSIYSTKAIKI